MATLKILVTNPLTGALVPGISKPPTTVTGIDALVQNVALLLLNNGGRSITNPGRAGGMRDLIGQNVDLDDPSELFTDVRLMVSGVEQQIKTEQVSTRRPPSERLKNLQLIDIIPNEETLSVEIVLAVVNEEQSQSQLQVAVP